MGGRICTGTSVAPCALPTYHPPSADHAVLNPLPLRRSLAKEERNGERERERGREPDGCNFARGRESSRSPTSRNADGEEGGGGRKARGNLLNSTRYASLVAAVCSAAATI